MKKMRYDQGRPSGKSHGLLHVQCGCRRAFHLLGSGLMFLCVTLFICLPGEVRVSPSSSASLDN